MATGGGFDFLLRMASTVVLARLLFPEDFGLVTMVTAITGMFDGVRDLGLSAATVQRSDISDNQVCNLFWINVTAGFLFFSIFSLCSIPISAFYGDERVMGITIAIATTFIWGGLTVQHEALLTRQLKQGELSAIRLGANILSLAVAIILAVNTFGYWALVFREILRNMIIACGVWLRCPWRPGWPNRKSSIGGLLRFGANLSATHFIGLMVSRLDGLLIGKFFGPVPLGYYRQAQLLITVPLEQLNAPIFSVAQPVLSRLQSDAERYRRFYGRMVFFMSLVLIPLGASIAVYAEEITLLVLGDKWVDSAAFLRIFSVVAAFGPVVGSSGIVIITCGLTGRYTLLALMYNITYLGFIIVGIQWGVKGLAIAIASAFVILALPRLYFSYQNTPITVRLWIGSIRIPLIASLFMMAAMILINRVSTVTSALQALSMGICVGGIVYASIVYLLPRSREEVRSLFSDVMSSLRQA